MRFWLKTTLPDPVEPDPTAQDIVDDWMDCAASALGEWGSARLNADEDLAHSAFDLLACRANLRRARTDLIEASEAGRGLLGEMDKVIERDCAQISTLVLGMGEGMFAAFHRDLVLHKTLPESDRDASFLRPMIRHLDDAELALSEIRNFGEDPQPSIALLMHWGMCARIMRAMILRGEMLPAGPWVHALCLACGDLDSTPGNDSLTVVTLKFGFMLRVMEEEIQDRGMPCE